jgi:hypothetical protein
MTFTVVYDANVLFPAPLRDLLIRVALTGLVRARWTDEILDECFANVLRQRPDLSEASLCRTRELMNRAVRDCLVTGYEPLAILSYNVLDFLRHKGRFHGYHWLRSG